MKSLSLRSVTIPMIKAIDSFNFLLKSHHRRTAVFSYHIGKQLQLSEEDLLFLVIAASLHDIGALSVKERDMLVQQDVSNPEPHCIMGYNMLESFDAFKDVANIIKHHHIRYSDALKMEDGEVMFPSYILHLADRVDVLSLLGEGDSDLKKKVIENIGRNVGEVFHPEVFDAFQAVSINDDFWLESEELEIESLFDRIDFTVDFAFSIDSMLEFTMTISKIIDFRSKFTASHSYTVAQLCSLIGGYVGLSEEKCKKLMIAGYLHDVGKIGIDPGIIEKNGPLSDEEFQMVKLHAHYTGLILGELAFSKWFEEIVSWAQSHHEKTDGKGYPHGLGGDRLDDGVKILAYSDIISALMEDRPYRKGLSIDVTMDILDKEMKTKISPDIFNTINSNADSINTLVKKCHESKANEYQYIM